MKKEGKTAKKYSIFSLVELLVVVKLIMIPTKHADVCN